MQDRDTYNGSILTTQQCKDVQRLYLTAFGQVRRPTKRLDCKNKAVVRYEHNNQNKKNKKRKKKKNNNNNSNSKNGGGRGVKSAKRNSRTKEHSKDKVTIFTSYLYKQPSTRHASPLHVAEGRRRLTFCVIPRISMIFLKSLFFETIYGLQDQG